MIELSIQESGTVVISPSPKHPLATKWIIDLFESEYFTSSSSDRSILPLPSTNDEFNEEWAEFSTPDLLTSCSALREKFGSKTGSLIFDHNSALELSTLLNQARLKIATDGTSDVLPPSEGNPRRAQYEFLTSLLETVLQIDLFLKRKTS